MKSSVCAALVASLLASCSGVHTGECTSDADCTAPEVCDLGTGACTLGCRTGPRVSLLVPRARVSLVVTLNGAPPPGLPSFAHVGGPLLELVPSGEAHGPFVDIYQRVSPGNDGVVPASIALDLVPGEYDARYRYSALPPALGWPAESDAVVAHLVVLETDEDQSFAIDITPVQLDIDTTLGGAPLPAGPGDADYVILRLDGAHGGASGVRLCPPTTTGPSTCSDHTSVAVLPDTYTISFESVPGIGPGPVWPAENGVIATVDATADTHVQLDIPVLDVTLALMHGGAPLDPSVLGGREVHLVPGSNFGAPLGVPIAVLPGTHSVTLDGHWPELGGTIGEVELGAGGIGEGGTVALDVDLVTVSLAATANGMAPPAGCLVGYAIDDWDGTDATAVSMLRGPHAVAVDAYDCPAPWPTGTARAAEMFVADADGARTIDVHTVHLALDLTYGGSALPSASGPAALILTERDGGGGAYFNLYDGDVPPPSHVDLWLAPGVYDVALLGDTTGVQTEYPNGPVTIVSGLTLDTDQSLSLDVGSVQASITTAIAGALPDGITPSTSSRIELVSQPPVVSFPLPAPHAELTRGTTVQTFVPGPTTVPLAGVTYDVRYVGQAWRGMPGGVANLGCWTVSE